MFDYTKDVTSKTLILVDGFSILYAGYYATLNKGMLNAKGEQMGAFHVFAKTIDGLLDEFPTHVGIVLDKFDPKTKLDHPEDSDENKGFSFRRNLDPSYKANRKKADDELLNQINFVRGYLGSMNLPILELGGIEADDIIASVVDAFHEQTQIKVITRDSDLLPLCEYDNVSVCLGRTGKGFIPYNKEEIIKAFGVNPIQLRHIKALSGDKSDNISGIPGFGPATAKKLVSAYGSVEGILKEARDNNLAPKKLNSKIIDNAGVLETSYRLVSPFLINIKFELDALKRRPYDTAEVDNFIKHIYNDV